jgi:hypothetical protein
MRIERRARLCVVLFLAIGPASFAESQTPAPAVNLTKIQVQPGAAVVRLVLEGDGPLAAPAAYYPADSPRTLVLELAGVRAAEAPPVPPSEAPFMRDIQVEKLGQQDLRILVRLAARVPVRVGAEAGRAVVEFTKVRRYRLDPETRALLDRRPKGMIPLETIEMSDAPDRVSFRARLGGPAVTQVFSLDNPLRLVVDLYDTILKTKTDTWTVHDPQVPVVKARAGQFQESDPRPITRLVFDLNEPAVYSVDADKDGAVVSFYKTRPTAAAEAKATPTPAAPAQPAQTPAAPAPKPAAKKGQPKTSPAGASRAAAAAPLVRKDLLVFGKGEIGPPRRDIFRPRAYDEPSAAQARPGGAPAPRRPGAKAEPSFVFDLTYLGSVRSGGKITALILMNGQTMSVVEGDEILPGYKAVRVTADEIEVLGPDSQKKTFSRQGERP